MNLTKKQAELFSYVENPDHRVFRYHRAKRTQNVKVFGSNGIIVCCFAERTLQILLSIRAVKATKATANIDLIHLKQP